MIRVDVEYEEPRNPELIINSDELTPEESSEKILDLIKSKKYYLEF